MQIKIKTTNFSLTPAIETYLLSKLGSLDKFLLRNKNAVAFVELAKTTKHHQQGDIFKAEVNLRVNGDKLIRAAAERWDLRVAIDEVKDELQEEIKKYKDKRETFYKKGARLFKKLLRGE